MKISIKIIISAFIISAVAVCKLPPIKYVTVTPPSIDIPAKNQPVKVTVNDSRKKSEASPTIFEEQFPDKTVQNIIKERLEDDNRKIELQLIQGPIYLKDFCSIIEKEPDSLIVFQAITKIENDAEIITASLCLQNTNALIFPQRIKR